MLIKQDLPAIGLRLRDLRKARGMTLDSLAAVSGVSRSLLSQIERGQANPTIATVWNLTRTLEIELTDLVDGKRIENRGRIELTAASFVPEIRTEDGRCVMRILSSADAAGQAELYLLTIEPGGELVSEAHARGSCEHLTVLEGQLTVTSGTTTANVTTGGIARYPGDVAHAIRNHGSDRAEALLVVMA